VLTDARTEKVEALVRRLTRWGEGRADVRALALVGSWAYGAPHAGSDVDVLLLTDSPARYTEHDDWLAELGGVRLVRTDRWGAVTERRVALDNGLEVEFAVGTAEWASVEPLDCGTRRVVTDGIRVLYDPGGLLALLAAACERP
jgi:uncharacterized protein